MTDMKCDERSESPAMERGPKERYPCGLRITLGTEELAKLGIKELPALKTKLYIEAKTFVCETSEGDSFYGGHKMMGLQITSLGIESEKEEASEKEKEA